MAVLTPAPTMYFDADGNPPATFEVMKRDEAPLAAKETVYHDAQVLPYMEPEDYAPPSEPKKSQCWGLICCFRPSTGKSDYPTSSAENFQKQRTLSCIKETSLTKEQIMRKQTGTSKVVGRKTTEFQSLDNDTSQELQEVLSQFRANKAAEEKKAAQSETVLRKLSRKFTSTKDVAQKDATDKPPAEKPSGIVRTFTKMLSRKITEPISLSESLPDYEFLQLKRFHGVWDGVDAKNKPGNNELARVMVLGWALRKALDNMPGISIQVEKGLLKNQAKVFGLVDIREERPWSGEKLNIKRKDLRGMAVTWVEKLDEGFIVYSEWPDPYAAKSSEEYHITDVNSMVMSVNVERATGESCNFKYYFTRNLKQ